MTDPLPQLATRRRFLISAAGFAGGAALVTALPTARAEDRIPPVPERPAAMRAALRAVVGEATVKEGRIKIELPPLVENGNAVPLGITVDSPMTDKDHVKAIHVFTEKNPQPNVISIQLGPRAGTANIQTRMRLADTQNVVAIAEMSDGTFWRDEIEVVVTLAACLEES
jgi:sulfur-oxidizing protein SoxY